MQVPIINGIYTDGNADFRVSYPKNLIPTPISQGISEGYLRPADGIVQIGPAGAGTCRGGINWNNICYRVMGNTLVEVYENGTMKEHGIIDGSGYVTMSYSFDYMSISAGKHLYLFNGSELQVINDPDLGTVVDHIWVDGYFMTTDGEYLVTTELKDPFSVNPLKYGSSEIDPDPVKAVLKLNNEPYVMNRYTTETMYNTGGAGFPFQRVRGGQIQKGCVGLKTCCLYQGGIAFMGGGSNESISIWLTAGGQVAKIATHEIDLVLSEYTEEELSHAYMEVKYHAGHEHLSIHLTDQTLVYDAPSSKEVGEKVWFTLSSNGRYRARHIVRCYDKWLVADTNSARLGYLDNSTSHHWGENVGWEFSTPIAYNEGHGAIFHELELVEIIGTNTRDGLIATQYSIDGIGWSNPKTIMVGHNGRLKRMVWFNQGHMRNWRIQRFFGDSASRISVARLEARVEALI